MPAIEMPSTQSLKIWMKFGSQELSTGTGFVVADRGRSYLATNRHNLTGRNPVTGQPISSHGGVPDHIVIRHNHTDFLTMWIARDEQLYTGETPRWIEHPVGQAMYDVVLLPLENIADCTLQPYDVRSTGAPILVRPSDAVSVVGFPFGIDTGGVFPVWATGFVASEPELDDPWFLIDCRGRPGQSGSAVIAHRSGGAVRFEDGSTVMSDGSLTRILGIYSGRINNESDLGIVWKSSVIAEILDGID